ncbi:hypothetical protein R9C00_18570 [Flammeovirgaceae bacterium SG7u.111]|nr:hypothetical protein [Flammeovirgaceae bacterium SG7u.132]WPO33706.1 hypothetical protein R9C00_18570 [Flammeovirgaceae bacterium SG7u.111]
MQILNSSDAEINAVTRFLGFLPYGMLKGSLIIQHPLIFKSNGVNDTNQRFF